MAHSAIRRAAQRAILTAVWRRTGLLALALVLALFGGATLPRSSYLAHQTPTALANCFNTAKSIAFVVYIQNGVR